MTPQKFHHSHSKNCHLHNKKDVYPPKTEGNRLFKQWVRPRIESFETIGETAYATLVIRSQNSSTEDGVNVTSFYPLPCYCFKILFNNNKFLT